MASLNVRVEIADEELLEVGEDVGRLLSDRGDFAPASCRLFFAIDEALTDALAPLLGARVVLSSEMPNHTADGARIPPEPRGALRWRRRSRREAGQA